MKDVRLTRKMKRILKDNDYELARSKGDHFIFKNAAGNTISIPARLNLMIMQRLIKENKLEVL